MWVLNDSEPRGNFQYMEIGCGSPMLRLGSLDLNLGLTKIRNPGAISSIWKLVVGPESCKTKLMKNLKHLTYDHVEIKV